MESLINSLTEKDDVEIVGSRVGRLNIADQSDTHPDADDSNTGLFDEPTNEDGDPAEMTD